MKKYFSIFLAVLVLVALAYLSGYVRASRSWKEKWDALPTGHHSDTVYVPDTSHYEAPEPQIVEPADTAYITVYVDKHDTVYVPVPIERRTYEGDDYRAVVSGYMPRLESIDVFKNTVYITNTETRTIPPPRWSVGITVGPTVGYGFTPSGRGVFAGIGGTVGVQWRF